MWSGLVLTLMALFLIHYTHLLGRRLRDEKRSLRLEREAPEALPSPCPSLSIVVPARNEEKHLRQCLTSLCSLDYDRLEILVVNDRSTDSTGEIARAFAGKDNRVRVIEGQDPPPEWTGKNFAIHQGATKASGTFLLIVDADTTLAPETCKRAVAYMDKENVDLLSLFPRALCSSMWERAVVPLMGVVSVFRIDRVNDPHYKDAMAYGCFLLFRRSSFDAIRGYEAIKDRVGEDWIISQKIKGCGMRLRMLMGTEFIQNRFGPSLNEIWQGFTKNLILIMQGRRLVALLALPLTVYQFFFLVSPWIFLVIAPAVLVFTGWDPVWFLILVLAASQCLVVMGIRSLLRLFLRIEVSQPYLQPLGGIVISAIGLSAVTRTLLGMGIEWKGRTYRKF